MGDKLMIGFALHCVGRVANYEGNTNRAICLFGAAKSLRGAMSDTASWSLTNHAECEQDIVDLRARLNSETFELVGAKGCAMNSDEPIDYALPLPPD